MRLLRNNGLSLVTFGLFVVFLVGQLISGYCEHNQDQKEHGQPSVKLGAYLVSGHFLESVFENWESEFLQMAAYVVFTAFLFQKGSAESKDPSKSEEVDEDPRRHRRDPEAPAAVRKGGLRLKLYEHSLSLALLGLFVLSFAGHIFAGSEHYNEDRLEHGQPPLSLMAYAATARFWFESFQNWQSEFLSVSAIVVLSIWLREKGSPESKAVASPHRATGK